LLPAALTAVQSGGEIWMLDSANYNTATVLVEKGVTILAVPGALGSVVADLQSDALLISTNEAVTLRNLNIRPLPGNTHRTGVSKNSAGTLTIQDCNIFGFSGSLGRTGTGVAVDGGGNVTVTRSVFRDNDYGLAAVNGTIVGIADSLFAGQTQYGIYAVTNVRLSVTRSVVRSIGSHDTSAIYAVGSISLDVSESRIEGAGGGVDGGNGITILGSVVASLSNNVISGNGAGVAVDGTGATRAFLSGNTIADNYLGIAQSGASIVQSAGNNSVRNNSGGDVSGSVMNVGQI
jgi:nitrous oxidase accessory protein NosD